jgi:uncharacterized membrane-anchored protein YjiN (DUF445 family)
MIITGVYYLFHHRIDQAVSKKGADLATDIVKSPDIQNATEGLIKQLFNQKTILDETNKFFISILSDPAVQAQIKETLINYLKADDMKTVINQFIAAILQDQSNLAEAKKFVVNLLADKDVQQLLKKILTDLLEDQETRKVVNEFVIVSLQNDQVKKVLNELLTSVILNEETRLAVQTFLVGILRDPKMKEEIYLITKALLEEVMKDKDFNKILVEFLSTTIMNVLNEPVNEKYIKDKVVELMTSKDVMESISKSVIDVVQRDDLKKAIGDSAVTTISAAIKKHYPKSFGWMV